MSETCSARSDRPGIGPRQAIFVAAWLGILAAWGELAVLGYRKFVQHRPSFALPENLSLLADYRLFWTVPLADTVIVCVPALLAAILAMVWPRLRTSFAAVAIAGALAVTTVVLNFTWLHTGATLLLAVGAGVRIGRIATDDGSRFHRMVGRSLIWMVGMVFGSGVGVTGWHWMNERGMLSEASPTAGSPNVLLIILDTVRSLNLSLYGYQRETTPHVTELGTRGVVSPGLTPQRRGPFHRMQACSPVGHPTN